MALYDTNKPKGTLSTLLLGTNKTLTFALIMFALIACWDAADEFKAGALIGGLLVAAVFYSFGYRSEEAYRSKDAK